MTKGPGKPTVEETAQLRHALQNLDAALACLDDLLTTDYRWVSAEGETSPSTAMAKIRAVYALIEGEHMPDQRALPGCRAIFAVTRNVVAAACRLNVAKAELQSACKGLSRRRSIGRSHWNGRVTYVRSSLSLALEAIGRPNLNMFAAYRRVPILTGAPLRAAFSTRQCYTVYRTPRDTIAKRLRGRCDADSIEDLGRIQQLPQFEARLALLTNVRPFSNAHIRFDGFDTGGRTYIDILTEMPIIYAAGSAPPEVAYSVDGGGPARKAKERAVCPDQYLKTLRVHRYLEYMEEAERRSR